MICKPLIVAMAIAATLAATAARAADNICPCLPTNPIWIATPCDTWNCAAAALINANGDPQVFTLPMSGPQYKWVVLRRVASGSVTVSPDNPLQVEQFTKMVDGSIRFDGIDKSLVPMMVTAADGTIIVLSLRPTDSRLRAAAH
jgi:hypothetical protein